MTAAPLALLICSFAPGPAPAGAPEVDFYPWRKHIAKFADQIERLEERDAALYRDGGPAPGTVLLAGSSSVRIWMENGKIAEDLAPYPAIARGYGGARFSDFAWYADRLFAPHLTPGQPGANVGTIALFVGNDISGDADPKPDAQTPKGAAAFVRHTVATAKAIDADVPVLLIAVTPTARRLAGWPRIRAFNDEMGRFAAETDGVFFLNTAPAFLNEDGTPKSELFRTDRLHLNPDGYAVWSGLIKEALEPIVGGDREG
jgi:hypothetical protein